MRIGTTAWSHLSKPRHLTREMQQRCLAIPCRADSPFACESEPLGSKVPWNAGNYRRCFGLLDLDKTCAMHNIGTASRSGGPAAPEGILLLHEQGHALHQRVDAVSKSIRPGWLHGHARRGKEWDPFVGLPQPAPRDQPPTPVIICPHTFLAFKVSRVLGRNLPAESLHPPGSG